MRTWVRNGLLSLALLAALPAMASPPTAIRRLAQLRADLRRDKAASDWAGYLRDSRRLNTFVSDAPLSVLEVARAQIQLGDVAAAREAAERYLAMGQTHPLLKTPLFAPLGDALAAAETRNETPIAGGQMAMRLSDPGWSETPSTISGTPAGRRSMTTATSAPAPR